MSFSPKLDNVLVMINETGFNDINFPDFEIPTHNVHYVNLRSLYTYFTVLFLQDQIC